jgi:serine-threonine kinase receptor-associated protein
VKTVDWAGDQVVTGNYDGSARIFDVTRPGADPVLAVPVTAEKPGVKAVYLVNGSTLCTANDKTVKLWDLRAGATVQAERELPGLNVLEYTHQHSLVAAAGKSIVLLNPQTLELVRTIHTSEDVECASLSPCGRFVCAGSKLKAKEFSIDGTELDTNRGHHGPIFHVRYAPDGTSYASGSEDSMVRLWPSHETLLKLGLANASD